MQVEQPIGYAKTNVESSDLFYSIYSCDYYTKKVTHTGVAYCSLFKIDPHTGN